MDTSVDLPDERPAPRRRFGRPTSWVACGVVALVAALVGALMRGGGDDRIEQTAPSTTFSSTTTVLTTTTVDAVSSSTTVGETTTKPPPLTYVIAGDGRLVALETLTGEISREIHAPSGGASVGGLSFSPDGTVAYFSESGPYERDSPRRAECLPRLFRYSSASGAVEHVGEGTGGVESPDRRYLAYVASAVQRGVADTFPSIGCGIYVVVVRDLQTGVERESIFSDERGGEASVVGAGSLAWSPDSMRLAYEVGFEGSWTYVFDLATSTTTHMKFGETVEQVGLGRFGGADMGSPRWTSRSELLVWIGCYACGREDLTAVSDDGRVVSSLVEQRTHPFVPTARGGWMLQWDRSASGAVYDYFVIAPNGSRTLLATGVKHAMWPGNDAFAAPATERYDVVVRPIVAGESLVARGDRLLRVDRAGVEAVHLQAHGALSELRVSGDGAFALVVEAQTDECLAHVWRIPLRGGVAVPFADARHIEPAPDGAHVWIEHVQRAGVNGDECRPFRKIERFDGGEVRGPRFTWFPGPDPQSIVASIWSPDGRVLVTSTKQGDIPWLQLWRSDGDTSVMATVGPDPDPSLAGYSVRPRPPHPQLDAIFGANGWGLGNPRFEGDSLVADVVCLGGDRCQPLPRFTVTGGEDGVFDEVNAR